MTEHVLTNSPSASGAPPAPPYGRKPAVTARHGRNKLRQELALAEWTARREKHLHDVKAAAYSDLVDVHRKLEHRYESLLAHPSRSEAAAEFVADADRQFLAIVAADDAKAAAVVEGAGEVMAAAAAIEAAIVNPGRNPAWHAVTMEAHREEWPTLWRAIDRLVAGHRKASQR